MGSGMSKQNSGTSQQNNDKERCQHDDATLKDIAKEEEPNTELLPHEVVTIDVSESLLRHSAGIAIDLGGSRCKIAYVKNATNESSEKSSDGKKVCVEMVSFQRQNLSNALKYIKKNILSGFGHQEGEKRVIRTTGVYMGTEIREFIERELQAEVRRVDEFSVIARGFKTLLHELPDDRLFYANSSAAKNKIDRLLAGVMQMMASVQAEQQLAEPETVPEPDATNDVEHGGKVEDVSSEADIVSIANVEKPYMIVCVGSATSCILVSPDGSHRFVSGSPDGGVILLSLAKLLVGTGDYKELMELASVGDETRVSTVGRDLRNNNNGGSGKDFYDFYPEDLVVYPLGKILDKKSEGARREDLAITLVTYVVGAVCRYAFWLSAAHDCQTVYLTGGLFDHSVTRDVFEEWFMGSAFLGGKFSAHLLTKNNEPSLNCCL